MYNSPYNKFFTENFKKKNLLTITQKIVKKSHLDIKKKILLPSS